MHSPAPHPVWRRHRSFRYSDDCLESPKRRLLSARRRLPSHVAPFRLVSLSSAVHDLLLKPDSSSPAAPSSAYPIPPSPRPIPSGHGPSDAVLLSDFLNAISFTCARAHPPHWDDPHALSPRKLPLSSGGAESTQPGESTARRRASCPMYSPLRQTKRKSRTENEALFFRVLNAVRTAEIAPYRSSRRSSLEPVPNRG